MAAYMYGQSVETRASSCVRIVSLRALVRVPLIDTLDNSPRVSIGALALEWRLLLLGRVSVGARERPRGGSPRAFEGVFDSFEGYIAYFAETLSTPVVEGSDWLALRGGFDVLSIERASSTPD